MGEQSCVSGRTRELRSPDSAALSRVPCHMVRIGPRLPCRQPLPCVRCDPRHQLRDVPWRRPRARAARALSAACGAADRDRQSRPFAARAAGRWLRSVSWRDGAAPDATVLACAGTAGREAIPPRCRAGHRSSGRARQPGVAVAAKPMFPPVAHDVRHMSRRASRTTRRHRALRSLPQLPHGAELRTVSSIRAGVGRSVRGLPHAGSALGRHRRERGQGAVSREGPHALDQGVSGVADPKRQSSGDV